MEPRDNDRKPTALIVGSSGQDGYYLSRELRLRGLRVVGLSRGSVDDGAGKPRPPVSLNDPEGIGTLLEAVEPDYIYYLAAYHHSSEEKQAADDVTMRRSLLVHVDGLEIMLAVARQLRRRPKVFLASSSHVFGVPTASPQFEGTPFAPVSAYGVTKHMAMQLCEYYSNNLDLFCATGILYNHESPRRPAHFVSRRITRGIGAFARDRRNPVRLGNLSAVVDWGAAQDYVRAMAAILEQDTPETFVIASGVGRTVSNFLEVACRVVGVNLADAVLEDSTLILRGGNSAPLVGDPTRLLTKTDWCPQIDFETMVEKMVNEDR
jgi:GDPmannose 4,6-dehydratase